MTDFQTSGSTAAFNELVTRHLKPMRNLTYRIVLCHATADDLTQESFKKVISHAASFRGDAMFSTWFYRITVNTAKEYLRKKRRRTTTEINAEADQISSPEYRRPEQRVLDDELADQVDQAMAHLSPKLRTAIVLTSIEQMSTKVAAEIEGCSMETMNWRVHEGRKKLKQLLKQYLKS